MHGFGDTQQKIADALRIPRETVRDAIQRGTIEDRKGRGRKRTARTPENIRKIKAKIQRNPSSQKNSARKLEKTYRTSSPDSSGRRTARLLLTIIHTSLSKASEIKYYNRLLLQNFRSHLFEWKSATRWFSTSKRQPKSSTKA